jgi:hypothetical protein
LVYFGQDWCLSSLLAGSGVSEGSVFGIFPSKRMPGLASCSVADETSLYRGYLSVIYGGNMHGEHFSHDIWWQHAW